MKLPLLILALLLSGCAELNAIRTGIGFYGAQASTRVLEDALWSICQATPIGAIKREFKTKQRLSAYNDICGSDYLHVTEN